MNKAFALPVIQSGNGSLEQYIHTVNSIPMLTAEEETQLAERQQKGDLNAAKQLILSHLRVVVSIARGYDGYGLNQADLIQEGNIGLMKAVKRYEPSRGARLFSFAVHWIKADIDWLADHDAEPSRQLSKQAHYALQTEGLQNALAQLDDRSRRIVESRWLQDDGGLTLHELAAEYGVSAERIRQIEAKAMQKLRGFLAEEAEAV